MLECCNVGEPSVMTSTPGGGYPTQSPQSVASLLNTMNMDTSRQSAFVLSPPLAALHNMTEMKTPATSLLQNPSSYASQTSLKPHYSFSAATPHGISDILSRAANNFNNLVAGIPSARLNSAAAGMYLNSPVARPGFPKPLAELPGRSPIYWPGPMLQNPAWRPSVYDSAQSAMGMDKDGKKKHTRPTFSGHQIFALEKTFEQTKYLAGPERARLAYALGMSESQVKVWFQNRRTKWRKRHAAEMATAKKRQEERAEEIGENSDEDEEDFESMGCKDDDQKLDTTSPSMQTHPQQTMYNGLVNCGPNVTHAQ